VALPFKTLEYESGWVPKSVRTIASLVTQKGLEVSCGMCSRKGQGTSVGACIPVYKQSTHYHIHRLHSKHNSLITATNSLSYVSPMIKATRSKYYKITKSF